MISAVAFFSVSEKGEGTTLHFLETSIMFVFLLLYDIDELDSVSCLLSDPSDSLARATH